MRSSPENIETNIHSLTHARNKFSLSERSPAVSHTQSAQVTTGPLSVGASVCVKKLSF